MATYIFPNIKNVGKAQTFSVYGSGILSLDFNDPNLVFYNGTTFSSGSYTGNLLTYGATSSAPSGGNVYWTDWDNQVGLLTSGSTILNYTAASGTFFNGTAIAATNYFNSWGGDVYQISGSQLVSGAYFASGVVGLQTDSTNLYSIQAPQNNLAVYSLTSDTASYTQPPVSNILHIMNESASASGVAVVGTAETPLRSYGAYNISLSPNGDFITFVNPANNTVNLATGPDPSWQVINTLAASGTAKWVAWDSTSTQVLTTDSSAAVVYDVANSALSVAQTISLSVSGYTQIVGSPVVDFAFMCNPVANQIQILGYSGGTWTTSGTISLTAPNSLYVVNSRQVGVTVSGGYTFLNYSTSRWNVATVTSLSYTPVSMTSDTNNVLYFCGNLGSSGYLSVVANNTTYTVSFTGSADQVYVQQGQIVILDKTNQQLRYYGFVSDQVLFQSTQDLPAVWNRISHSGLTIFGCTNSSIYQYYNSKPFTFAAVPYSWVTTYSGGSWGTVYTQKIGFEIPTCVTYKSDGSIWFATTANNLYTLVSGAVSSSTITNYQNNTYTQPIGISDLMWYSDGHLYATTSMNSALLQLL